jgi:cytoskeletal protein CcmA (bactofilin family)
MAIMGKRDESTGAVRINPADAHTILGREAKFSGKLTFEGAVRIDGNFEGEIFTDDLLLVGPGADVKAQINVGSIIINGTVEGDITAKVSVEIKAPGRLRGNVVTPALIIEKGVVFDGTCKMSEDNVKPIRAAQPVPPPAPKVDACGARQPSHLDPAS